MYNIAIIRLERLVVTQGTCIKLTSKDLSTISENSAISEKLEAQFFLADSTSNIF